MDDADYTPHASQGHTSEGRFTESEPEPKARRRERQVKYWKSGRSVQQLIDAAAGHLIR
jgi:hypothetical protein